jgi:hypothetical protein
MPDNADKTPTDAQGAPPANPRVARLVLTFDMEAGTLKIDGSTMNLALYLGMLRMAEEEIRYALDSARTTDRKRVSLADDSLFTGARRH